MPKSWDLVGIEFEYTDFNLKGSMELITFLEHYKWTNTHDASVESPSSVFIDNSPVKGLTLDGDLNKIIIKKTVIGGEIITPILETNTKEWVKVFDAFFGIIKSLGERSYTNRGSIHVHVNFPLKDDAITKLKNAWILAGFLEAFFYRIGCMGRPHRGDNFDFIYCRPILGNGPPIVSNGRMFFPLLIYDDILKSSNADEFFCRCGDIIAAEGRYHPSRYFWINFYNLRNYHSSSHIEFRVFNKTMRIDYLYAVVELCKYFVKAALEYEITDLLLASGAETYGLVNLPENSSEYFERSCNLLRIPEEERRLLKNIWDRSDFPFFDNSRVFTHLKRVNVYFSEIFKEWRPAPLSNDEVKKVQEPFYIDIHALERNGETIFPEEKECAS
jgi:hypothetical protein